MTRNNPIYIRNIEQKIAKSRRRLMHLWDSRGFTDSEVLAASIKLDKLMNLFQQLKK